MRCHSGIPPNRIGISWSQILTPRDRNIALSLVPVAQMDDAINFDVLAVDPFYRGVVDLEKPSNGNVGDPASVAYFR